MRVGLMGRSCSGKDKVASLFDERFVVIDEDKLGHKALEENKEKLISLFGKEILNEDGSVNRRALSSIVFNNSEKLSLLEGVTHPWMKEETKRESEAIEKSGKIAVINAAILERMGLVELCDMVIVVLSDYEKRLERAIKRDNITPEAFKKRSESQSDIGQNVFSSGKKVITILNNEDEERLSRQVALLCATIK